MVTCVILVSATKDSQKQQSFSGRLEHALPSPAAGDRAEVSAAWEWLDAQSFEATSESVPLSDANDRMLATSIVADGDRAGSLRAAENGYAVRASECDGASAYNPLTLALLEPGIAALRFGSASAVATGWLLPSGADAVLRPESAVTTGKQSLEVLGPVAPGTGIERWPHGVRPGATLLERSRKLRPQDVCCLAAIGIDSVPVLRRPRIAIVVAGAKSGFDALTPLLTALLVRDGAVVGTLPVENADEFALTAALTALSIAHSDIVLLAGRGGTGQDDTAAAAIRAAGGSLTLHGIALRPGSSTGLGTLPRTRPPGRGVVNTEHGHETVDRLPIVLLPGDPFACLIAYDILVARLIRRMSGEATSLPYAVAEFELARKISSGLGITEIVPVKLDGDRIQPIGIEASLAGAVLADGFVVIAAASEGYPPGARVRVHLYDASAVDGAYPSQSFQGMAP
jgi:molybdopterin molybdotransferase